MMLACVPPLSSGWQVGIRYTLGVLRNLGPEPTWRISFVRAVTLVRCGEHNLRSSSVVKFLTRG
jgi:hypothetical protein